MADNPLPFKKRASAFDSTPSAKDEVASKPAAEVKKEASEPIKNPFASSKSKLIIEDEPEVVVKEEPKPVETVKPVAKPAPKKVVVKEEDDPNREKYTATMEKTLRRRVKIAAIELGLQVSSFIEEACREKLEREGR